MEWKNQLLRQLVESLMMYSRDISGEAFEALLAVVEEIEGPEMAEALCNATDAVDDGFYLDKPEEVDLPVKI
jgi:hypothetical protein